MSDLISRSELLKAMDTWDKFGYDEHNRLIKIDRTNEEYAPYVHYEDMVKCVNDMPTAYSVDKVVATMDEALIELEDGTNCGTCVFKDVCDDGYDGCVQTIVAVCKSIVKKGGASDDVCEWKLCDEEANVYDTSCGNPHILIEGTPKENNYEYCPYCGKKIKVVE